MDSHPCENLTLIAHINDTKWALVAAYRKPSIPERLLQTSLDPVIDKCTEITPNIIVTGDLNCNMLKPGRNAVRTLCEDFNLVNVVNNPTCFKASPPTLLDVILVSSAELVTKSEVIPCPLSDFHHFVTAVLDIKLQKIGRRQITYRSYKHFDIGLFNRDLEKAPFHVSECLEVEDQCEFITKLYRQVLDEHAPLKTKTIRSKQCPYMNSAWRRAIFKKHQLYNRLIGWCKFRDFLKCYPLTPQFCSFS